MKIRNEEQKNKFNNELNDTINSICKDFQGISPVDTDKLRNELYKIARPIYIAKFIEFNHLDPVHRRSNQIGFGFPYINSRFPWPLDSVGNEKQPVIQLDLVDISQMLGVNVGSGLLQVWICADYLKADAEIELRRISPADINNLEWIEYPKIAPWRNSDIDKWLGRNSTRFSCIEEFPSPLVEWELSGYQIPHESNVIDGVDGFEALKASVDYLGEIDYAQLIISSQEKLVTRLNPYVENSPLIGGYTIEWGNNEYYLHDEERPDRVSVTESDWKLLFHIQYFNGIGRSGIYARSRNEDGKNFFDADIYERFT
jgi:hypothetical protein